MGLLAIYVLSRERLLLRCADANGMPVLLELVLQTGYWSTRCVVAIWFTCSFVMA